MKKLSHRFVAGSFWFNYQGNCRAGPEEEYFCINFWTVKILLFL